MKKYLLKLMFVSLALNTTIFVPDDYLSIQEAIDASVDSDTILVSEGVYYENINFFGKSIVLIGENTENTIINGSQNSSVVIFESGEDSTAVLSGFTIQNGYNNFGAGIATNTSDPTLSNLIIQNNEATSSGGGMTFYYSNSILTNTIFRGNHAQYGGGVNTFMGNPTIYNVLIINNTSSNGGAGMRLDDGNFSISNITVCNNISSGDYVVVKKQSTARTGQMVVAQTEEGEATLKYWHPESNRIRLQPANAAMDPIYVSNASGLGVVVGVIRSVC